MIAPSLTHRHVGGHHHHHHGRDVHAHGIGLAASKRAPALPADAFLHRTILNVGRQAGKEHSRRSDDDFPAAADDDSDRMINLLLTVLGLVFFSLIIVSVLVVIRRARRQRAALAAATTLPKYHETTRNPHNLTIETTHNGHSSVVVYGRDGHPMLQNPQSPPHSPDNVPEIRITFPDEQDANGQPKSGRVLVVRVGENATVGLEPLQEEQLPVYEKEATTQFYAIDMDQIGGLKDEKDRTMFK